jgi:hypothetical protein
MLAIKNLLFLIANIDCKAHQIVFVSIAVLPSVLLNR